MVTGQLHCPVETMAIMCVVIIMLITQMHSDFNEGDVCISEDKIQAAGPWRDRDESKRRTTLLWSLKQSQHGLVELLVGFQLLYSTNIKKVHSVLIPG